MSELSKQERQAMRELEAKATPRPWATRKYGLGDEGDGFCNFIIFRDLGEEAGAETVIVGGVRKDGIAVDERKARVFLTGLYLTANPKTEDEDKANAEWVCAARAFVPKALDDLDAAEARMAELEGTLRRIAGTLCRRCLGHEEYGCTGWTDVDSCSTLELDLKVLQTAFLTKTAPSPDVFRVAAINGSDDDATVTLPPKEADADHA